MVDFSPWPVVVSASAASVLVSLCGYFWGGSGFPFGVSFIVTVLGIWQWWRDVVRESTFQGCHTNDVCNGIYLGVILFIMSEVMFFFSFFFGFFFTSLAPDVSLGSEWPPVGVQSLSWASIPLFNTVLLLSSGVTITWSHHSVLEGKLFEGLNGLVITVCLGVVFMCVQVNEYFLTPFSICDTVYGSLFFLITGFHGVHVLVGIVFILISLIRVLVFHMSSDHNLGLEAAIWYWHFVDVVWLFLFISVYWWGS